MLSYLAVKNFAIIENIEVQFKDGFTVLTGETGAGKSLLIDAIGLLLGDRANSSIIRSGFDTCEVTGLFTNIPSKVVEILKTLEIPYDDGECLIKRQVTTSSTNVIKVNQQTITLSDLRSITQYLADIHTQHDTKRLINPETYLTLIDYFNPTLTTYLSLYQDAYTKYLTAHSNYFRLQENKDKALEKQMVLKAQIEEIDKHQLKTKELENIEESLKQLQNFDKIFQNVKRSYVALSNENTLENIYQAFRELASLSDFDDVYKELSKRVESAYYELDDIKDTLSEKQASLDFDPTLLEQLETREHALKSLMRKYTKSIDELIEYHGKLSEELNQYEHLDAHIEKAYDEVVTCFKDVKDKALALRSERQKTAHLIETSLIEVLKDLELKSVLFEIVFNTVNLEDPLKKSAFDAHGIDTVDFYLSTNIGEHKKPLNKVASGGELSRIMLALKEIFMRNMNLSLMIFDEIDTGVSGFVASQVASKMKEISAHAQVLSITHLPQVAAKADVHYQIYKSSDAVRTKAHIKALSNEERIEALAEMISSEEITEEARKSAANLLK